MGIDYLKESEKYRPATIKTLLIGEAPPASGEAYFYVPRPTSDTTPIERDRSLPATIFNHYFQERPTTTDRYKAFLLRLKEKGILLIDICDDPIKVRGCPEGLARIVAEIPKLHKKMAARKIDLPDSNIIFLLARKTYAKHIRTHFPESRPVTWMEFRMSSGPLH